MTAPRSAILLFGQAIAVTTAYFLTARLGLAIESEGGFATMVWPPAGIALATLFILGLRVSPAVFIGAFLANYTVGAPLFTALGIAIGNTLEALCGAFLLRRMGFLTSIERIRDVAGLIGTALPSAFVSASIGALSLYIGGVIAVPALAKTWATWWLGDAVGMLTFGSLLFVWWRRPPFGHRQTFEFIGWTLATVLVSLISFHAWILDLGTPYSLLKPYLLFPVLVWAAFRLGQRGATVFMLVAMIAGISGSMMGSGPLKSAMLAQNLLYLQSSIGIVAVTLMMLTAAISELHRAMAELKRTQDSLREHANSAQLANDAKSDFLANVSHEIRTPLSAILGFVDFLLDPGQTSSDRFDCVMTIKKNGEMLSRIVDDVLDLTKVEAGKLEVEQIDFSFREFLEEFHKVVEVDTRKKGLRLEVRTDGALPLYITSDPVRLRQILFNLVGNATKFTAKGTVSVRFRKILRTGGDKPLLEMTVSDTGIGMSEAQVAQIFRPFSQGDGTMSRRFGGTGLGLFLSRKLADALGGKLELRETKPGEGSVFVARIPISSPRNSLEFIYPEPNAGRQVSGLKEIKALEGMKILVVEDTHANQILIDRILSYAGADVDIAETGSIGLEKARNRKYDLVLMDIQMPEMDGHQTALKLRLEGFANPVIALTAHAMKGDREKAADSGFDDYLTKPVDRKHLIETVNRWSRRTQEAFH